MWTYSQSKRRTRIIVCSNGYPVTTALGEAGHDGADWKSFLVHPLAPFLIYKFRNLVGAEESSRIHFGHMERALINIDKGQWRSVQDGVHLLQWTQNVMRVYCSLKSFGGLSDIAKHPVFKKWLENTNSN